ncbi:hypothetical protein [Usitatibacter rugosus]|nr:hypothetical protein [Usitatibacter rugosus]
MWSKAPVVVLAAVLALSACSRDPRTTRLPLDLADIPKIQKQLDKLPPDERELVLAYLQRSKGDVLPAKFADPDNPLTARTFAEAIKLQKEWKVKHAADTERMESLAEAREEAYEPLRRAISATLLRREIMTADEASGRQPQPGRALNNNEVLVVTYRLQNHGSETITRVTGSVQVRSESDPKSLLGLAQCWIDHREPVGGSQSVEVRCSNLRGSSGERAKDFVALDERRLIVTWEPKTVEFATGKVLRSE